MIVRTAPWETMPGQCPPSSSPSTSAISPVKSASVGPASDESGTSEQDGEGMATRTSTADAAPGAASTADLASPVFVVELDDDFRAPPRGEPTEPVRRHHHQQAQGPLRPHQGSLEAAPGHTQAREVRLRLDLTHNYGPTTEIDAATEAQDHPRS